MLRLTKYHSPDVTGALHRVPVGEVALGVDVDQPHRVGAQRLPALAVLGETAAIYCILLLYLLLELSTKVREVFTVSAFCKDHNQRPVRIDP